jgi:alginate O-acetyltransferase complex protein AlgI
VLFFEVGFLFLFLPAVLLGYYALPQRLRNGWLLLASLVFYAFASLEFLHVLLLSALLDFVLALRIARTEGDGARKALLLASVALNLGILGYFKYSLLVTETLRAAGFDGVPLLQALLPVGISFYTFQSMSYTIDVYRQRVAPTTSLVDYLAYVTLFPQLIAGPIVRYQELEQQLAAREHSRERFARGVHLFVLGLAKKVVVADTLALFADPLFALQAPSASVAWTSTLLFGLQIYFDFSGYTDMAIGLGRMVGFEFPVNFDSPYRARSFSDFWRRWHMTLSRWLRDNLYIPLGGNRRGAVRTYANLAATMLLGGLWHGASWNFLVWGAGHGLLLAIERAAGQPLRRLPGPAASGVVLLAVTVLWVPFRCDDLDQSLSWLGALIGLGGSEGSVGWQELGCAALGLGLVWLAPNTTRRRATFSASEVAGVAALLVLSLFLAHGQDHAPFLYFRF